MEGNSPEPTFPSHMCAAFRLCPSLRPGGTGRRPPPPPPPRRLLLTLLLLFALLVAPIEGQFGEIASVITSLVASGAGPSLAGLGGTGASLGAAGASAGSGAAGALGGIGSLYQLAQAALQLTGTGVGIANQASESAWFPVVVENAARMNKDFQERLLGVTGQGAGATKGTKGASKTATGGSLGSEYGTEFGSGEEAAVETGGGNSLLPGPDLASVFSSSVSVLPPLLPEATVSPFGGFGRPMLPGTGALLPGEVPATRLVGAGESARGIASVGGGVGKKLVGIGSVEEVPLFAVTSTPSAGEEGDYPVTDEWTAPSGPTTGLSSAASASPLAAISSPKITVKLPDEEDRAEKKANAGEAMIERIETEFSTDSKEERDHAERDRERAKTEAEEEARLEPLIPVGPASSDRLNMTHIERIGDGDDPSQMVPELRKLISQLKMGTLSGQELEELHSQLIGNSEAGEPRENTEPPPVPEGANGDEEGTEGGQKRGQRPKVVSEKRTKASNRNLEALRKGLEGQEEAKETVDETKDEAVELVDGRMDPILRKVADFNRPPVILSLERHLVRPSLSQQGLNRPHQTMHRIEGRGEERDETAAAAVAGKDKPRQLGVPSENVQKEDRALSELSEREGITTTATSAALSTATEAATAETPKTEDRTAAASTTTAKSRVPPTAKRPAGRKGLADRKTTASGKSKNSRRREEVLPLVDGDSGVKALDVAVHRGKIGQRQEQQYTIDRNSPPPQQEHQNLAAHTNSHNGAPNSHLGAKWGQSSNSNQWSNWQSNSNANGQNPQQQPYQLQPNGHFYPQQHWRGGGGWNWQYADQQQPQQWRQGWNGQTQQQQNNFNNYNAPYQQRQWTGGEQQQFPGRTVPPSLHTMPPSVVQHPFSSGTLLTLG